LDIYIYVELIKIQATCVHSIGDFKVTTFDQNQQATLDRLNRRMSIEIPGVDNITASCKTHEISINKWIKHLWLLHIDFELVHRQNKIKQP
jgi:hypothetical protein